MSIGESMQQRAEEFRQRYTAVREQIGRVIVGHDEIVHGVLTCLFVGGHCLLEGVPGLGKTLLVRTLAQALDLHFSRIQFTPDLMPADILGTNMVLETADGKRVFEFQRGPIFTQICLADEINRATPKTQSALLETMQEGTVTASGTRHELKKPFFVMATQNPIEQEGTYPLPEAQLDRFFFKLLVGYSSREELATIVERTTRGITVEPEKVMDGSEILKWQQLVREVILATHVQDYIVRLVLATHPGGPFAVPITNQYLRWGSQSASCADAGPGRQGPGAARRPLQRQLRGRPPRLPAGPAAPRDPELRGPGRSHRHRPRAVGDFGEAARKGGGTSGHGLRRGQGFLKRVAGHEMRDARSARRTCCRYELADKNTMVASEFPTISSHPAARHR